jgi:hypothetical protein
MVAEASDEHRDSFVVVDVRDGYPCFREVVDVVTQRFIWIVSDFLQIILLVELLTSGHVVVDESPPELNLGVNGAFPQAEEPLVHRLVDDHRQVIGRDVFITVRYSDGDFVHCYPLFGIGLLVISVQVVELEISWPNNGTEPIGEWLEADDVASMRCIATVGCAMCFIIFMPALHLMCMSPFSAVLDVTPQINIGAEVVTEVASRLLHFLVGIALSTTTAATVCSTLASLTCATSALLVAFAPLISIMFASLVGIASSALISGTVYLVVSIVALIKIWTSLLLATISPGTSLAMTSGGRR